MKIQSLVITSLCLTALVLSSSCELQDADMDTCCECLINTAADGSASTDGAANCYADDGDGDLEAEAESCASTSTAIVVAGAAFDDGFDVAISADGCRTACLDACTAVDDTVKFESPVVSAGECTLAVDGAAEEVTNVMASIGAGGTADTFIAEVRMTTNAGDWILNLIALSEGAGTYTMAPFSDFGMSRPTGSVPLTSGNFAVSQFDQVVLDVAFDALWEDAGTAAGACTVDFTVNDGETSGMIGLDANDEE